MTTHLALPRQRRTECMRRVETVPTTDTIHGVTCKACLRRYLSRLALMKAMRIAKEKAEIR